MSIPHLDFQSYKLNPQFQFLVKQLMDLLNSISVTTTLTGDITGSGTGTVVTTLATVNLSPGTYGDSSHVSRVTVNGKGLSTQITSVLITPAAIGAPSGSGTSSGTNTGDQTITLTGDITGSGTGSFATTLASVNSNVGSFTNANITVNAKGLITAAATGTDNVGITTVGDVTTGAVAFDGSIGTVLTGFRTLTLTASQLVGGAGGPLILVSGAPDATHASGSTSLRTSPGGATSGGSGTITIRTGDTTNGLPGGITLSCGTQTTGTRNGANVIFRAGNAAPTSGDGGTMEFDGGSSGAAGYAGPFVFVGGLGEDGAIDCYFEAGSATNGNGANLLFSSGYSTAAASGSIIFKIRTAGTTEGTHQFTNEAADSTMEYDPANSLLTAPQIQCTDTAGFKSSDGSAGFTGTVTTASLVGKTITIKDGIITDFS